MDGKWSSLNTIKSLRLVWVYHDSTYLLSLNHMPLKWNKIIIDTSPLFSPMQNQWCEFQHPARSRCASIVFFLFIFSVQMFIYACMYSLSSHRIDQNIIDIEQSSIVLWLASLLKIDNNQNYMHSVSNSWGFCCFAFAYVMFEWAKHVRLCALRRQ